MKRTVTTTLLSLLLVASVQAQEVTGLSDWSIFIDPGHGGSNQNVGVFGYSEASKVLGISLELREMLENETDIGEVHLSRTTDIDVALSQRADLANASGADFFHSIHSNAAAPSANHVFVLWPQHRDGSEVEPTGGRRMAEIMGPLLGQAMRISWVGTSGAYGECDFYGASTCRGETATGKGGSRNYVQSFTNMASVLSEAGFHTNPTQNQRNMNAEWKRLEARAIYWSYLDYHEIDRPEKRIVTGIIRDHDTGLPINGAVVETDDREYTTDTYESLFHNYSNDPDELRNGFYYFEDVPAQLTLTVSADNYHVLEEDVETVDDFLTFADLTLVTSLPPQVATSSPAEQPERFRVIDPIVIDFSRRMDRETTEAAISITPEMETQYRWSNNDMRLTITPAEHLDSETTYTLLIADTAEGEFGDLLDGDADGEAGGNYEVEFTTGPEDVEPPRLVAGFPSPRGRDVPLHPVLSFTLDERVDHETVDGKLVLTLQDSDDAIAGTYSVEDVGEQSVLHFYPDAELQPETSYVLQIGAGITDIFGNAMPNDFNVLFTTGNAQFDITVVDNFESNVTTNWWDLAQSGSTTGTITEETARFVETDVVNRTTGSTQSFGIQYAWDVESPAPLIRAHLGGGAPRTPRVSDGELVRAYIFGDGSNNEFRFSVRDGRSGTGPVGASPWISIDWFGWRLVTWDLGENPPVLWAGDGQLGPTYFMESLQMRYVAGAAQSGTIYIDDLHYATQTSVSAPIAGVPDKFGLEQNYPNPFNPSTTIPFTMATPGPVTIRIYNVLGAEVGMLVDDSNISAGRHEVSWDASSMPSGVYFVHMEAGEQTFSQKLVLLK